MSLEWRDSTPWEKRFWSHVSVLGDDDCWPWVGATNNSGYGSFGIGGKIYTAHRVSAYLYGLVDSLAAPKDRKGNGFALHKCDNRKCCNPRHVSIGTYSQNQLDAYQRGQKRQPKGYNNSNAVLAAEDIILIRERYSAGLTSPHLAKQYSVCETTILNIINRRTYTNV